LNRERPLPVCRFGNFPQHSPPRPANRLFVRDDATLSVQSGSVAHRRFGDPTHGSQTSAFAGERR
jgi:hypothetical protein